MPDDVVAALRSACAGLLFPSERDEPLIAFVWRDAAAELDAPALLRLIGRPAGTPVETLEPDLFFQNAAADQDWHDETDRAAARGFRELLRLLKDRLSGLRAFRVGKTEIDAYVVGKTTDGIWAGVTTKLIET